LCLLQTPRDAASSGIFGPLTLRSTATVAASAQVHPQPQALSDETLEKARKRLHVIADNQSPLTNGPGKHLLEDGPSPAKRPRLSNGYENGLETAPKSPMDVDEEAQNGNGNAYPSPEMLPSPIVATNGPEKGTQMGRVEDLTPQTTFLDLHDDTSSASKNTVLLQCEWNPQDPTLLAASGTDALARLWTISSRATTADLDQQMDRDRVSPPYSSLLEEGSSSKTIATIIAWAPDGSCIAIASEPGDADAARVEIWTKEDTSIAKFEAFYPPVILLRWNNTSTLLLALSPSPLDPQQPEGAQGTLVRIMAMSGENIEYRLPNHDLNDQLLDATWTSNDEFVLCGGDLLQAFTCTDGVVTPSRKYEIQENYALSKATFDWHSRLLATASDTGKIHVSLMTQFKLLH
jgi:transducin (beta)-like 1